MTVRLLEDDDDDDDDGKHSALSACARICVRPALVPHREQLRVREPDCTFAIIETLAASRAQSSRRDQT